MYEKGELSNAMKKRRIEMNVDNDDPHTWYMPRWQWIEYDPEMGFVRAASQFARDFWEIISRRVQFVDPVDNKINVVVRKDEDDMWFTHGWNLLKDIYVLNDGGWIKLYYKDRTVFKNFVYDRDFEEVQCPIPVKEYDSGLTFSEEIVPGYRETDNTDIHHVDKRMTELHASGTVLNLPTALYERFRHKVDSGVLRDKNGVAFPINLSWSLNGKVAYITKGWKEFSLEKNLERGSVVRFRVDPSDSGVIHTKVLEA
ncbi:DNA-binding barrel domain superfamily [Sesbania bispinosa]|nr:DNA-binding barrel domain superfamily [Sesbania bispinosa]